MDWFGSILLILNQKSRVLNQKKPYKTSECFTYVVHKNVNFELKSKVMASAKVVLRTSYKKQDGTSPIVVRLTQDRKSKYVFTGYYIQEKHWDKNSSRVKRTHPNSSRLNNLLLKKHSEVSSAIIDAEAAENDFNIKEVVNRIKGKGKTGTFFQLGEKRIAEKAKEEKLSVVNSEKSMLNVIRRFVGHDNLSFQSINEEWLEQMYRHCLYDLGHKPRSAQNHLMFIRTLFNRAIRDGLATRKMYPFGDAKFKISRVEGEKEGLNEDEVKRIESLELKEKSAIWHTRNVWLFSFYFAGVRISDVLKISWSDLNDNRLSYRMSKNAKLVSLKIPEKAKEILEYYGPATESKAVPVFPELNGVDLEDKALVYRKTRTATKKFNKYLKQIAELADVSKNLSNHISRHTFGKIAGERIHPLLLQKLYRHSDLRTTINYQANFIHSETDKALDDVVGF